MSCFVSFFCPSTVEPVNGEVAILNTLQGISREVHTRSGLGEIRSFEEDGTTKKVLDLLKQLVHTYNYSMYKLESAISTLNIRLYSVPVPPESISINPITKFQYHRILQVFLGTPFDWEVWKATSSRDVSYNLEDTGFEEKKMPDEY